VPNPAAVQPLGWTWQAASFRAPLLSPGRARCQLVFAIRMVLQLSAQDIGQLPYFEVRQRSTPSPFSVCATQGRGRRAGIGATGQRGKAAVGSANRHNPGHREQREHGPVDRIRSPHGDRVPLRHCAPLGAPRDLRPERHTPPEENTLRGHGRFPLSALRPQPRQSLSRGAARKRKGGFPEGGTRLFALVQRGPISCQSGRIHRS
jgi:hypothetical protein